MNNNISFTNFYISAIPCGSVFAYKNEREGNNQAVTDFGVRFSVFTLSIFHFPIFTYSPPNFWAGADFLPKA